MPYVKEIALTTRQLTTNADKKNAYLTCKDLQALTLPLLYKHMEISYNHLIDAEFRETLKRDHPGFPHARSLGIISTTKSRGRYHSRHEHLRDGTSGVDTICQLLSAIPKGSLTRFE